MHFTGKFTQPVPPCLRVVLEQALASLAGWSELEVGLVLGFGQFMHESALDQHDCMQVSSHDRNFIISKGFLKVSPLLCGHSVGQDHGLEVCHADSGMSLRLQRSAAVVRVDADRIRCGVGSRTADLFRARSLRQKHRGLASWPPDLARAQSV